MNKNTYNRLKFTRTRIGGSNKSEHKIFSDLLDEKNEYKNADWVEYKRKYLLFSDDMKILFMSWRYLLKYIIYGVAIIALWFLLHEMYILFGISLFISVAGLITRKILTKREILFLINDETNIKATNKYIKESTGMNL